MKKIILLLTLLVLIASCKTKSVTVTKPDEPAVPTIPTVPTLITLSSTEVNAAQKNKAYELGKRVLMTCNTSKFKPFTQSEATPKVIQNTTQDRLTKTCLKFRLKYGDFKDLRLVEVIQNNIDETFIYRYKAEYVKKIANKELRVTMDKNNRVSAIKSTDWVNQYNPM